MAYQLIFSPRLDLTPGDFVTAWNTETATQTVARASLVSGDAASYNLLVDLVSLTLTNVGFGLATNALYDLITSIFSQKGHPKHIKIVQLDRPDGTHLLTIDIDE